MTGPLAGLTAWSRDDADNLHHMRGVKSDVRALLAALAAAQEEAQRLRTENDEWQDWSNSIADQMPESYDGDEAQEGLIDRWIADTLAELAAARTALIEIERLVSEAKFHEYNSHDTGYVYASSSVNDLLDELRAALAAVKETGSIDYEGLQADLDELERTDPDVAAAAKSYDAMQHRLLDQKCDCDNCSSGRPHAAVKETD